MSRCAHACGADLRAFALGELDALRSAAVLDHVETCAVCSRELDWLADVIAAAPGAAQPLESAVALAPHASAGRAPRVANGTARAWTWRAAGLLAAAAAVVLFFCLRASDPAALADRSAPAYVEIELRGVDDARTRSFAAAMQPYVRGDYAQAVKALSQYLEAHPEDPPARFYRGAARFQVGDLDGARDDLELCARWTEPKGATSVLLREHARWVLAQIELVAGHLAQARKFLEALAAEHGSFADDASSLLRRLPATPAVREER